MAKKTFAVIGLGRFGYSVVEELIKSDFDVLVIDRDEQRVNKVAKIATHAVVLDTSDEGALRDVGIQSIDHVIVAIGKDIEDSILTTLILKELGVKKVTVKVQNEYHEKVVLRLGADEVIQPEQIAGRRLAHRIVTNNILEFYDLNETHSFIVIESTPKLYDTTVVNLDLRSKYNINLVAIKRGEEVIIPGPEEAFSEKDQLLLVGKNTDLHKFSTWCSK
ncbi:MAG: potassium channel family protein [Candidatus Izemoplasmataceae bacterium]|jgi:trk system potassium uptake protein|uniref:potassium channel family protein n=1 Tax=Liberiplasma polymorphum TaxID=3374570 RepID=UPI0037714CAA